jgi:sugar-specific transcriptional regulator TrmB
MDETRIEQLIGLGLTRYEAAVYGALLDRQGFTPAQVAARANVPRQRIYDVLASLSERGLCIERHNGQRSFYAVDPEVALPALLAERRRQQEAELHRQQEQASQLIGVLAPLYHAGSREDDPLEYIDVLLDKRRVAERAVALANAAEREILVCFKRPVIGNAEDNLREVREPLSRGVRYRAIYERALLDDRDVHGWVRTFVGLGQQARVVDELPIKVNLFDERVALLSPQDPLSGAASFTALCVTHAGFTRMLALAFEGLWNGASDGI